MLFQRGPKGRDPPTSLIARLEYIKEMQVQPSKTLTKENMAEVKMSHFPIRREILRSVIGAGRENLRWIKRTTGAVVKVTEEGDCLSISGTKSQIGEAETILKGRMRKILVRKVQVEGKKMAILMGVGGQNIQMIERQT